MRLLSFSFLFHAPFAGNRNKKQGYYSGSLGDSFRVSGTPHHPARGGFFIALK